MKLVPCPPDLLESMGLLVPPDLELGRNGWRATNRQLRLFVASWVIDGTIGEAKALYESAGFDLDKPGDISQADIEREVWALVDIAEDAKSNANPLPE